MFPNIHISPKTWRIIGILGTFGWVALYAWKPSWPTPDKLIVFLVFIFMMFGQAKAMLRHLGPFVLLLAVYESFRGLAPVINSRVNYMWMVRMDELMFGQLPTATLQSWWWKGHVQWYDFLFYLAYMMHFVLPLALALLIWKRKAAAYWRYITSFVSLSFAGFITYVAFPAAPPWLASDKGYIQRIDHLSGPIWQALGVEDFPSLYSKLAANPVAAVPSLHSAYATLLAIYAITLFKSRWRFAVLIYPFLIYVGTIYMGEHYVIDAILGILYAFTIYWLTPFIMRLVVRFKRQKKSGAKAAA